MVTFFLFPGYFDSVLLGVDLDLGSVSGALRELICFHSENLPSYWGLIFAIFRRSCPRNTSETTRRDVTVCKTRCRLTTIACFV